MKRGFITIDYDEPKAKTYRGVHLHIEDEVNKFDSGDFIKDWFNMNKFIAHSYLTGCSISSSYDHFFMDGAKYNPLHLVKENDIFELRKCTISFKKYQSFLKPIL